MSVFPKKADAKIIEAKKDAMHAAAVVPSEHWSAFRTKLKLGYIDPAATFDALSPQEQRIVLCLAYYGALRMP